MGYVVSYLREGSWGRFWSIYCMLSSVNSWVNSTSFDYPVLTGKASTTFCYRLSHLIMGRMLEAGRSIAPHSP